MIQKDLFGGDLQKKIDSNGNEELGIMKSALQKYIRRGETEKAMFWADRLVRENSFIFWKRIRVIATEDVGQAEIICAIDVLNKNFWNSRKEDGPLPADLDWEARKIALCAAKLLSESPKDRRCDEFLEVMHEASQGNQKCIDYLSRLSQVDDYVFDMHTPQGRKMKRGQHYWVNVSSETKNKTPGYSKWRIWWKKMMTPVTLDQSSG